MKVLFVHGALVRDGAWWWSRMVEPLKQHGLDTASIELPSCGGNRDDGLYADAEPECYPEVPQVVWWPN